MFALSRVAAAQEPKGSSHQRGVQVPTETSLKDQEQGTATIPRQGWTIPVSAGWVHTPLTPPAPKPKPSGASPKELAQPGAASWQREPPAASSSQRGCEQLHTRPVESRLRWWPQQLGVALGALGGDHFRRW